MRKLRDDLGFGDRGGGRDGGVGEGEYAVREVSRMVGETVDGGVFAFKIRPTPGRLGVVQQTGSRSTHPEDPEKTKYFNKKLSRKAK